MTEQSEDAKDTDEEHTCPFKVEINGDTDFKCHCSPQKQRECAEEV